MTSLILSADRAPRPITHTRANRPVPVVDHPVRFGW
jgi:hypothetical protein